MMNKMSHIISLYKLIYGKVKGEMPPLPPYPDDWEDEGIFRPEDEDEQP